MQQTQAQVDEVNGSLDIEGLDLPTSSDKRTNCLSLNLSYSYMYFRHF